MLVHRVLPGHEISRAHREPTATLLHATALALALLVLIPTKSFASKYDDLNKCEATQDHDLQAKCFTKLIPWIRKIAHNDKGGASNRNWTVSLINAYEATGQRDKAEQEKERLGTLDKANQVQAAVERQTGSRYQGLLGAAHFYDELGPDWKPAADDKRWMAGLEKKYGNSPESTGPEPSVLDAIIAGVNGQMGQQPLESSEPQSNSAPAGSSQGVGSGACKAVEGQWCGCGMPAGWDPQHMCHYVRNNRGGLTCSGGSRDRNGDPIPCSVH